LGLVVVGFELAWVGLSVVSVWFGLAFDSATFLYLFVCDFFWEGGSGWANNLKAFKLFPRRVVFWIWRSFCIYLFVMSFVFVAQWVLRNFGFGRPFLFGVGLGLAWVGCGLG
jgi:hypothetical protein